MVDDRGTGWAANADGDHVARVIAEVARQNSRLRVAAYAACAAAWLPIFGTLWVRAGGGPMTGARGCVAGALFGVVLCLPLLAPVLVVVKARGPRRAVQALAAIDDVRAIGAILRAREQVLDTGLREALTCMAASLLERVTPAVRVLLAASDLRAMADQVRAAPARIVTCPRLWDEPALTIAALGALVHVGDAACLRVVEQLASSRPRPGRTAPILARARECAEALTARLAMEKQPDVLLRPATRDDTTLLRAVPTASYGGGATLVRPSVEPSDKAP